MKAPIVHLLEFLGQMGSFIISHGLSPCEIFPQPTISTFQELSTASLGLPVWDLIFEDHFDRLTCVPDRNGVLRPNPLSWTPEIGCLVAAGDELRIWRVSQCFPQFGAVSLFKGGIFHFGSCPCRASRLFDALVGTVFSPETWING